MKYVGCPNGLETDFENEKRIIIRDYNCHGGRGGRMLCFLKDTNECIGYIKCGSVNEDNYEQIDYKLFPQYWRKGYGYELVSNFIKYLYEVVKIDAGIQTDPNILNIGSIRICEKCGLRKIESVFYEENGITYENILMRMTKKEYIFSTKR
ncbi:hypothetical protein FACS1894152_5610 [Bacilli bacterium]|nr:hypothetical protein FACS1894152_5610 [Bacilli bacterium]